MSPVLVVGYDEILCQKNDKKQDINKQERFFRAFSKSLICSGGRVGHSFRQDVVRRFRLLAEPTNLQPDTLQLNLLEL
jgi:hypothetical protein